MKRTASPSNSPSKRTKELHVEDFEEYQLEVKRAFDLVKELETAIADMKDGVKQGQDKMMKIGTELNSTRNKFDELTSCCKVKYAVITHVKTGAYFFVMLGNEESQKVLNSLKEKYNTLQDFKFVDFTYSRALLAFVENTGFLINHKELENNADVLKQYLNDTKEKVFCNAGPDGPDMQLLHETFNALQKAYEHVVETSYTNMSRCDKMIDNARESIQEFKELLMVKYLFAMIGDVMHCIAWPANNGRKLAEVIENQCSSILNINDMVVFRQFAENKADFHKSDKWINPELCAVGVESTVDVCAVGVDLVVDESKE